MDLASAPFMPPVLDQGKLGTCTAHAAANAYRFALVKEARQEQAFMPRWGGGHQEGGQKSAA